MRISTQPILYSALLLILLLCVLLVSTLKAIEVVIKKEIKHFYWPEFRCWSNELWNFVFVTYWNSKVVQIDLNYFSLKNSKRIILDCLQIPNMFYSYQILISWCKKFVETSSKRRVKQKKSIIHLWEQIISLCWNSNPPMLWMLFCIIRSIFSNRRFLTLILKERNEFVETKNIAWDF